MNTTNLAALITAVTGCIGAVTALIIAVRHIINHDSNGTDKPAETPGNSGSVTPANRGKTTL